MRVLPILAVAVLIFPSGAAVAGDGFVQGQPWAHFSRTRYLAHMRELVEIGTGKRSGGADFRYVVRLTRTKLGKVQTVLWADSATCAAIAPVIASMTKLTMPRPAPYGVPGEERDIVVDGTGYELGAPSSDVMGKVTISSNEGSPLSKWVNEAMKRLDTCWSASVPA